MYKVKITVLKKAFYPDLAAQYLNGADFDCPCMQVGDTFVAGGMMDMPEGFCAMAWQDLYPNVIALSRGGGYGPYTKEDHSFIACCTDGVRPVTFILERGEEETGA